MMSGFTQEEYKTLAGTQFNEFLQNDPILNELEHSKYDKTLHAFSLLETLHLGAFSIGKLPVKPLTAAKWAFLWILDNKFVTAPEAVTATDVDVMLYVLSIPDLTEINVALHDIPAVAAGYRNAPGTPLNEVIHEINTMIQQAFLPLAMLPSKDSGSSEESYFDEIWLTAVAGCAARESGMPLDYCMHKMSLSCVFALWINYRRREGSESAQIRYPVAEEIEEKISGRINELAREFLTRP